MFNPGIYFIGDPFDVLSDKDAAKVKSLIKAKAFGEHALSDRCKIGIAPTLDDQQGWVRAHIGGETQKDTLIPPLYSDVLGCVPMKCAGYRKEVSDFGLVVLMKKPFSFLFEDGIVHIGHITVDVRETIEFFGDRSVRIGKQIFSDSDPVAVAIRQLM